MSNENVLGYISAATAGSIKKGLGSAMTLVLSRKPDINYVVPVFAGGQTGSIVEHTEGERSTEIVLRDVATITGDHYVASVAPLLDMTTRETVGFQIVHAPEGAQTVFDLAAIGVVVNKPVEQEFTTALVYDEEAPYGWVAYNDGPCGWFWDAERAPLEHELTSEGPRPATFLERAMLQRIGGRILDDEMQNLRCSALEQRVIRLGLGQWVVGHSVSYENGAPALFFGSSGAAGSIGDTPTPEAVAAAMEQVPVVIVFTSPQSILNFLDMIKEFGDAIQARFEKGGETNNG